MRLSCCGCYGLVINLDGLATFLCNEALFVVVRLKLAIHGGESPVLRDLGLQGVWGVTLKSRKPHGL